MRHDRWSIIHLFLMKMGKYTCTRLTYTSLCDACFSHEYYNIVHELEEVKGIVNGVSFIYGHAVIDRCAVRLHAYIGVHTGVELAVYVNSTNGPCSM